MMARFYSAIQLDPLSPHQKKTNNVVRVQPPLAKLSGSAHVYSNYTRHYAGKKFNMLVLNLAVINNSLLLSKQAYLDDHHNP